MAKKYIVILSVLLVLLVGVAAVLVTGTIDINEKLHGGSLPSDNSSGADYTKFYTQDAAVSLPLMSTDISGVYYTMSKTGDVRFYKLENKALTEIPETGSFDVTAKCSGQNIPAKIHYIEYEGVTQGFGLYTSALYEGVYLYDFAFFKVCNMYPAFSSDGTLLMMLDVDSSRFYLEDKVYSEIFYLYSDHTSDYFLSEDQRTVDINARDRTDYKMFTDEILSQGDEKNVLFFSSRHYLMYEDSAYVDIFTSGGSGTNVDNIQYITNVAALVFWRTDAGTYFFAKDSDTQFSLYLFANGERTLVKSFTGNLGSDYLRSGSYLLNKATGEVYNVLDGSMKTVVYTCFKSGFTPDMFTMSENGSYCIIRGANTSNNAACGLMDFTANSITAFTDEIFGNIANMHVLNDGTAVISVTNGVNASAYYQLIGKLN